MTAQRGSMEAPRGDTFQEGGALFPWLVVAGMARKKQQD